MAASPLGRRLLRLLLVPSIASLLGALMLFAICLGLLHPRYAINDDLKIIAVLAGYPAGNAAPFPIFSNVILGLILTPLYALHTAINWEIVLFLAVDLVSVWTLLYILLSGSLDGRWKRFASALILIAASYFVLNITFTNVAGLACFAGLSAILASAKSYSPSRPLLLAGIALIFIGSLVRLEMLALALPIILAASIFLFRSLQLRMLLVGLAGAALAVVGGIGFDRLYVRAHPDWNLYYFYNKTAQGLQDAHRLGNAGLIIKHISWSKNDQELFARSFFPDPQVYSVERIQFLIDHVPGTGGSLTAAAGVLLQRLLNPSGLPAALLVLSVLLMALTGRPSRSVGLAVIAVAGASLAENLFLEWFYKDPDYVLFTLLANTAILLILLLDWPGARNLDPPKAPSAGPAAWLSRLALLPILAVVALVANRAMILSDENLDKRSAYRQLLTDLGRLQSEGRIAQDAVIISPSHGIPWEWSNPLILEFPPIPFLDTGWITFSPFYEGALQRYGLEPLPQALYERPNVYVMTKQIFQRYLAIYYQEHEHITVTFEPIYTMPNLYNVPEYTDTQLYKVIRVK